VKRGNYICSRRHGGCPNPQSITATASEAWALERAEIYYRRRAAEAIRDDADRVQRLERRGEIDAALHELASVEARRTLGEDWLPMMRRLRAEKVEIDAHGAPIDIDAVKSWDDLTLDGKWAVLRRIAPHGAVVDPMVSRKRPELRLSLLDYPKLDAELGT